MKKPDPYALTTTIDAKESDYLYIQPSQLPDAGNGLFTAITIYKDEVISLFRGEILSDEEAALRAAKGNTDYFMNMPDGTILDTMRVNGFAKYANDVHGSEKTNYLSNARITLDENNKVCIAANRNIKSGEEIFCSYGKAYWKKKLASR
jgi:SET domain-containing protein